MHIRWILISALAAAVVAGAVNAAGSTDPKSLLLRSSDVPSSAKRISFGGAKGAIKLPRKVHAQVAYVAYTFKNGSKNETVADAVGIFGNSKDAHDAFASTSKKATGQPAFPKLSVKRFGDEQFARGVATRAYSAGLLVVRNGTRVWEVVLTDLPGFSKSRMISELEKYGTKAKNRAT